MIVKLLRGYYIAGETDFIIFPKTLIFQLEEPSWHGSDGSGKRRLAGGVRSATAAKMRGRREEGQEDASVDEACTPVHDDHLAGHELGLGQIQHGPEDIVRAPSPSEDGTLDLPLQR